jgi:hypothetical protein
MALDGLKIVTFKEGEPFDPNKLNDMQSNISTAYTASSVVYNSTVNGAQSKSVVPVIKSGQIRFGDMKAGDVKTESLPADIRTENLPAPHVVATFRNKAKANQIVTVSVHEITTNPSITVYTNQAITSCMVDWIAVTYRDVATS